MSIYKIHVNIKNQIHNHPDNLFKPEKKRKKDEKKIKDMVVYFTRYVNWKWMKMLSLYYHELMGKLKNSNEKNI